MSFEEEIPKDLIDRGIEFLKKKGVFDTLPEDERALKFSHLCNPELIKEPEARTTYEKAQQRLLTLVSTDEEIHLTKVPDDVHLFSEEEFPGYVKENVYFLKNPKAKAQRQNSGLCYMHAPAMLQHYKICESLPGEKRPPMIDLLKFVKEHFTPGQLRQHLFEDRGRSSDEFLESILEPGTKFAHAGHPAKLFQAYGPGLVSHFEVHEDFQDSTVHKHYGEPKGDLTGLHAMVLVGHRTDELGKQYYLLQNFWTGKQFVEVDKEYLENCNANIIFVTSPQKEISSPVHYATYAALVEGIDRSEGYSMER